MQNTPNEVTPDVASDSENQGPTKDETQVLNETGIKSVDSLFEGMDPEEAAKLQTHIYDLYSDAMRLRDREPLEEGNFKNHFFYGGSYTEPFIFGEVKNGYLLGVEQDGVFVPTHFAPESLRGGYRLIKGLLEEDVPTALFITQDLVDTIEKMDGWKVIPFKIHVDFHGQEVEKTLVINKWSVLPKLAVGETQKVARSTLSHIEYKLHHAKYYLEEFGGKVKALLGLNKANADSIELNDEDLLGEATLKKISSPRDEDYPSDEN